MSCLKHKILTLSKSNNLRLDVFHHHISHQILRNNLIWISINLRKYLHICVCLKAPQFRTWLCWLNCYLFIWELIFSLWISICIVRLKNKIERTCSNISFKIQKKIFNFEHYALLFHAKLVIYNSFRIK